MATLHCVNEFNLIDDSIFDLTRSRIYVIYNSPLPDLLRPRVSTITMRPPSGQLDAVGVPTAVALVRRPTLGKCGGQCARV